MKRLLLFLLLPLGLWAQCTVNAPALTVTGAVSNKLDNRTKACNAFTLYWAAGTGISAVSIAVQGSDDGASFTTLTGATVVLVGTNPGTTLSGAMVIQGVSKLAFLQVKAISITGSGSVAFTLTGQSGVTPIGKMGASGTCSSLGGDVTGPCASNTVVAIQNHAVSGVQGNGALAQLSTGSTTTNDCVKFDANGNTVDAGGPCASGGTGNAASIVTYTTGATPTLTCPSSTAGTAVQFIPSAALTANVTSLTFASCTTGEIMTVKFTQDGTGGRTVAGLPTGAPQISPYASVSTTFLFYATSSSAVSFAGVVPDGGPEVCTEQAAPTAPPTGRLAAWCDSTDHLYEVMDHTGTIYKLGGVVPLSQLATQAADTVVMNATGGSASPTAVAMPTSGTNGCAGASNALTYNTSTHGLGCNTISGGSTGFKIENVQAGSVDATNTAAETDLMSFTLAANEIGNNQVLQITARGWWQTTGTQPNPTLRLYFGATAVFAATFYNANNLTDGGWEFTATCIATGAAGASVATDCQGMWHMAGHAPAGSALNFPTSVGNSSTINLATNASNLVKLTAQWTGAVPSCGITETQFIAERLN